MHSKIAMPYFVGVPVTAPPASTPLWLCLAGQAVQRCLCKSLAYQRVVHLRIYSPADNFHEYSSKA